MKDERSVAMNMNKEAHRPRFSAIDCIGAMWLAVTVHDALRTEGISCSTRYAVDHGGTPAVQVRSPDLGRAGLVLAKVEGIMAILSDDVEGDYLCVHETPEHRALALAVG
jgi:hypothetical protein